MCFLYRVFRLKNENIFQRPAHWLLWLGCTLCSLGVSRPITNVQMVAELVKPSQPIWELWINGQGARSLQRSAFVIPGEKVELSVSKLKDGSSVSVQTEQGKVEEVESLHWHWQPPENIGIYRLTVTSDKEKVEVNAFVMVPFERLQRGKINGYRIGRYPRNSPYDLPKGFIEVTEENQDAFVSAHFRVKNFLCKQPSRYPKYLVLNERLVAKLEAILESARERGYSWETFRILSAFRTPFYNQRLGKKFSRHQWGDAVDLMVDQAPEDGRMDDLNGDGKSDVRDSLFLRDLVDELERDGESKFPVGGIGVYTRTRRHGSFVHVDARGNAARWGIKKAFTRRESKRKKLRSKAKL